jgi:hypothetical protein
MRRRDGSQGFLGINTPEKTQNSRKTRVYVRWVCLLMKLRSQGVSWLTSSRERLGSIMTGSEGVGMIDLVMGVGKWDLKGMPDKAGYQGYKGTRV